MYVVLCLLIAVMGVTDGYDGGLPWSRRVGRYKIELLPEDEENGPESYFESYDLQPSLILDLTGNREGSVLVRYDPGMIQNVRGHDNYLNSTPLMPRRNNTIEKQLYNNVTPLLYRGKRKCLNRSTKINVKSSEPRVSTISSEWLDIPDANKTEVKISRRRKKKRNRKTDTEIILTGPKLRIKLLSGKRKNRRNRHGKVTEKLTTKGEGLKTCEKSHSRNAFPECAKGSDEYECCCNEEDLPSSTAECTPQCSTDEIVDNAVEAGVDETQPPHELDKEENCSCKAFNDQAKSCTDSEEDKVCTANEAEDNCSCLTSVAGYDGAGESDKPVRHNEDHPLNSSLNLSFSIKIKYNYLTSTHKSPFDDSLVTFVIDEIEDELNSDNSTETKLKLHNFITKLTSLLKKTDWLGIMRKSNDSKSDKKHWKDLIMKESNDVKGLHKLEETANSDASMESNQEYEDCCLNCISENGELTDLNTSTCRCQGKSGEKLKDTSVSSRERSSVEAITKQLTTLSCTMTSTHERREEEIPKLPCPLSTSGDNRFTTPHGKTSQVTSFDDWVLKKLFRNLLEIGKHQVGKDSVSTVPAWDEGLTLVIDDDEGTAPEVPWTSEARSADSLSAALDGMLSALKDKITSALAVTTVPFTQPPVGKAVCTCNIRKHQSITNGYQNGIIRSRYICKTANATRTKEPRSKAMNVKKSCCTRKHSTPDKATSNQNLDTGESYLRRHYETSEGDTISIFNVPVDSPAMEGTTPDDDLITETSEGNKNSFPITDEDYDEIISNIRNTCSSKTTKLHTVSSTNKYLDEIIKYILKTNDSKLVQYQNEKPWKPRRSTASRKVATTQLITRRNALPVAQVQESGLFQTICFPASDLVEVMKMKFHKEEAEHETHHTVRRCSDKLHYSTIPYESHDEGNSEWEKSITTVATTCYPVDEFQSNSREDETKEDKMRLTVEDVSLLPHHSPTIPQAQHEGHFHERTRINPHAFTVPVPDRETLKLTASLDFSENFIVSDGGLDKPRPCYCTSPPPTKVDFGFPTLFTKYSRIPPTQVTSTRKSTKKSKEDDNKPPKKFRFYPPWAFHRIWLSPWTISAMKSDKFKNTCPKEMPMTYVINPSPGVGKPDPVPDSESMGAFVINSKLLPSGFYKLEDLKKLNKSLAYRGVALLPYSVGTKKDAQIPYAVFRPKLDENWVKYSIEPVPTNRLGRNVLRQLVDMTKLLSRRRNLKSANIADKGENILRNKINSARGIFIEKYTKNNLSYTDLIKIKTRITNKRSMMKSGKI